jgi:Cof subfamily protein (haloacid dehalogenase superfamily)
VSGYPFRGVLLLSDMDGTLLDSKRRISEKNKAAINRFIEGGGLFTVATGRMKASVELYKLPISVPSIIYNGAIIYDFKNDKTLWSDSLQECTKSVVAQVMEKFKGIGLEVYSEGSIYIMGENEHITDHVIRERITPVYIDSLDEVPGLWTKVLFAWDPKKLPEAESFLKGFTEPFEQVYSEPQFLEMLNKGVSKGSGLRMLKKLLDEDIYCIIAVGDNMNDIELIQEADIGIAVGNAQEPLKKAADYCCIDNDHDAIAEIIDKIENIVHKYYEKDTIPMSAEILLSCFN